MGYSPGLGFCGGCCPMSQAVPPSAGRPHLGHTLPSSLVLTEPTKTSSVNCASSTWDPIRLSCLPSHRRHLHWFPRFRDALQVLIDSAHDQPGIRCGLCLADRAVSIVHIDRDLGSYSPQSHVFIPPTGAASPGHGGKGSSQVSSIPHTEQ